MAFPNLFKSDPPADPMPFKAKIGDIEIFAASQEQLSALMQQAMAIKNPPPKPKPAPAAPQPQQTTAPQPVATPSGPMDAKAFVDALAKSPQEAILKVLSEAIGVPNFVETLGQIATVSSNAFQSTRDLHVTRALESQNIEPNSANIAEFKTMLAAQPHEKQSLTPENLTGFAKEVIENQWMKPRSTTQSSNDNKSENQNNVIEGQFPSSNASRPQSVSFDDPPTGTEAAEVASWIENLKDPNEAISAIQEAMNSA
jgi:hypothetical protein